jgi:hypothetical protein
VPQEPLVPLVEEATIGTLHRSSRDLRKLRPVNLLQSVLQSGTIEGLEDRILDPCAIVGTDAKQVGVKRSVMDLAQREPIADCGTPAHQHARTKPREDRLAKRELIDHTRSFALSQ